LRCSPNANYDDGDGDATNVDGDDDEDDDDDESGHLHDARETRHDLEMNGNRGRCLVRAETDSGRGTQLEPLNMRAKDPQMVATRRSWVRPLITPLYPLILTGIACR